MACVYIHRTADTNEIFYVGIGINKYRATSDKNRNDYWKNVVNKHGFVSEILFNGIDWGNACIKESELIQVYGRRDLGTGILVNMTHGGQGTTGPKTEEHKHKIAMSNKGKKRTEEQKRNISKGLKGRKAPNKGIKLNPEQMERHRLRLHKPIKQFTIDDVFIAEYSSAKVAADVLGIGRRSITNCCRGWSKTANGFIWRYSG
jgi:hypothetical protein